MLLGCTTELCSKWMHERCIIDNALRTTYNVFGTDKPHLPQIMTKNEDSGDAGKRSLSPKHSINAEAEDNVKIEQAADGEADSVVLEDLPPLRLLEVRAVSESGESPPPWEGLFEATLKTKNVGPPQIEFKDLREGVIGGEKTWTEWVNCLLCGNQVK